MTTSPESSAANTAPESPTSEKPAAKSAQLRGRTEPHMQSINMPQREPIDPYERPSYPFFYVPTDLLIGGSWVTGDNGSFPVHNPSCGQLLAHVADASIEQGIEALDAACDARTSWDPRNGQAPRPVPRRSRLRGKLPALVRRRSRPQLRPHRRRPRIRAADHHRTPPRRPLPADYPLELPARHGGTQGRPGTRCGLHRGAQARLPDPAQLPVFRVPDA